MNAVGQEYYQNLPVEIKPEGGAREPEMADAVGRKVVPGARVLRAGAVKSQQPGARGHAAGGSGPKLTHDFGGPGWVYHPS